MKGLEYNEIKVGGKYWLTYETVFGESEEVSVTVTDKFTEAVKDTSHGMIRWRGILDHIYYGGYTTICSVNMDGKIETHSVIRYIA